MIRVFMFVLAVGVVLLAGGLVYLGMFPPNPQVHVVDKTLPNTQFQSH